MSLESKLGVLKEVEEVKYVSQVKPIVTMEKYFSDATKFWEENSGNAVDWNINNGNGGNMVGKKIIGNPGGLFTNDGKVVSFWYVPS